MPEKFKIKSSEIFLFLKNFFTINIGSEYNEAFKKLTNGIIISNAILVLFDIIYILYLKIPYLEYCLLIGLVINGYSFLLNQKDHSKVANYLIVILNLLIFPVNTMLFSVNDAFYFISVLGGIILAVHFPRLYEFIAAATIGVILFLIERKLFDGVIFADKILSTHPVLFYIRTAIMFIIYAYWLYLFKRNHYLHSKIIAGKDLTLLKYITALNQTDACIFITDKQGNIEYTNPQIEKSTGYSKEELLGQNPRIFQSGKTHKETFVELWSKLEKGETWKGSFYNKKKNKEEYTVQSIISPVKNFSGEIINYVSIMEDITENLKMISDLRESNEKYRQLSEQIDDIIWKIDLKSLTFNYINPAAESMLGYSPQEITGSPLKNYFTDDSYKCLVDDLNSYLKSHSQKKESKFRMRYQMMRKNDQIIDIEVFANFVIDDTNNPYEAHGIARDITQQIKEEQELNQTNEDLKYSLDQTTEDYKLLLGQLTNIFNNASNAISFFEIKDQEIFFTSCNYKWASNIGYKQEELPGKNITTVLDDATLNLYRSKINKALKNGAPLYEEVFWLNKYLYLNIFPIQDQNGKQYCLCFIYNITEKKIAEERLQETEQRFINIFRISKESIAILKPNLSIEQANESFYNMVNVTNKNKINHFIEILSPKNIDVIYKNIELLNNGKSFCQFETEIITRDKFILPVEINLSLIKESQKSLLLCAIRDVSIRKNYEKKLIDSSIRIENRERQNLANDLHDNVGPLLSSLKMCLSLLFRIPEVKKYNDDINDINKILKESISAVREISNNLSPQVLVNHGLISALNIFFDTKQKLIHIDFNQNIDTLRFDPIKEAMLYNILKEVFNNSVKYSQSSGIQLNILKTPNSLHIEYKDFGIGFNFDEKLTPASNNLGIFSTINRLKILEGEYHIKTAPGEGFILNIIFPI